MHPARQGAPAEDPEAPGIRSSFKSLGRVVGTQGGQSIHILYIHMYMYAYIIYSVCVYRYMYIYIYTYILCI